MRLGARTLLMGAACIGLGLFVTLAVAFGLKGLALLLAAAVGS